MRAALPARAACRVMPTFPVTMIFGMPPPDGAEHLVAASAKSLRSYMSSGRNNAAHLREAATFIVQLRALFTLADGRIDWGGRTHGYREQAAAIYRRAGVAKEDRDGVQSALRYHVGAELRRRVSAEGIRDAGLTANSPRERITAARNITAALASAARELSESGGRVDPLTLVKTAEVLLARADEVDLSDLPAGRRDALRLTLGSVRWAADTLLARLEEP